MKSLIIDSTGDKMAIICYVDGKSDVYIGDAGARRHTGEILIAIDNMLTKNNIKPIEIDTIGIVIGPGSFTGIRIGVATANAMAFASGAKIVEITSLEPYIIDDNNAIALLDCKHGYYALKKIDDKQEYFAIDYNELDNYKELKNVEIKEFDSEKVLKTFLQKVNNNEFKEKAGAFYMKKCSAEMM